MTDNCKSETELWHACLGHLNVNYMYQMCKSVCVIGLKCDNSIDLSKCETCLAGKIASTPFTKSETRSTEMEIIHADVCDPMRCNSLGSARYFITFIDDRSRWCEVHFMRTEAEVFDKFKEFKNLVENQIGHKIKALQSDNGREFLKAAGIKRCLTVPHTPQQNGVAERINRTLIESALCLLIESGLPSSFWAEAMATANHVRNRCVTKSLPKGTPYEVWFGKRPNVSHLHVFGEKVYILNKDPTKGKFGQK